MASTYLIISDLLELSVGRKAKCINSFRLVGLYPADHNSLGVKNSPFLEFSSAFLHTSTSFAFNGSASVNGQGICNNINFGATRPRILQVDNGSEFRAMPNYCRDNNIKLVFTTTYTPTSNGLVERLNSELRNLFFVILNLSFK